MKKLLFLLFFIISLQMPIWSEAFDPFYHDLDLSLGPDSLLFFRNNHGYFTTHLWYSHGSYSDFVEDDIYECEDGYQRIKILETEFIIIYGGIKNFVFFTPERPIGKETYVLTTAIPIVEQAKSSSNLTEKIGNQQIEYSPDYLLTTTVEDPYLGTPHWNINNNLVLGDPDSYPWVEGVEGAGVGESLDIKFIHTVENFALLNGYVDPRRPYLYKQNGRVKKIQIESLDLDTNFSAVYDLEDVVSFQTVSLPKLAGHIKITILDIYSGTKYSDTAITGLFSIPTNEEITKMKDRYISFEKMLKTYKEIPFEEDK